MDYVFKIEKNGFHYIAVNDTFPLIYSLFKCRAIRKAIKAVFQLHKKRYNFNKKDLTFYTWEEDGDHQVVEYHQIIFEEREE